MKRRNDLLTAWDSRAELPDEQQFSSDSRENVASIFLDLAKSHDTGVAGAALAGTALKSSLSKWSDKLVSLAKADDLPVPAFCAELRSCQISLLELLVAGYLEGVNDTEMATTLSNTLNSLEQLIESSTRELKAAHADEVELSASAPKGKVKTLQHEIRTPLQGALLTTELMLEDSQQGDKVQSDDIIAVRRSIETAVQILNDFAERPPT